MAKTYRSTFRSPGNLDTADKLKHLHAHALVASQSLLKLLVLYSPLIRYSSFIAACYMIREARTVLVNGVGCADPAARLQSTLQPGPCLLISSTAAIRRLSRLETGRVSLLTSRRTSATLADTKNEVTVATQLMAHGCERPHHDV